MRVSRKCHATLDVRGAVLEGVVEHVLMAVLIAAREVALVHVKEDVHIHVLMAVKAVAVAINTYEY